MHIILTTTFRVFLIATAAAFAIYQKSCADNGEKNLAQNMSATASATPTSTPKPGDPKAFTPFCPSGNGYYVLYYETKSSDYDRIIAERPNYAVLPQESNNKETAKKFKDDGIRPVIYVSMIYSSKVAASKLNLDIEEFETCGPNKKEHCSCALIKDEKDLDEELMTVVDNGFDGIFFDCARFNFEDEPTIRFNQPFIKRLANSNKTINDWNGQRVAMLRKKNPSLLIIMNPGVANVDLEMFDYADIVYHDMIYNDWTIVEC